MALRFCVVCGATSSEPVFTVARVPIHPFAPPAALGLAPGFGRLEIVTCSVCGHLYNAAFDLDRVDALYAANVLTNTPVSEGMIRSLEETAAYLLARAPVNPVVADVGGGTGALSRALARRAQEVHLVEPSRALRPEDFAGSGVTLHQSMFPAPNLGERLFDLIVCRQVVEHIPEPLPFLEAIRSRLHPEGVAYIELPSAEYIELSCSIVDFHYPHVHYYRREAFETLLTRAGLEPLDVVDVKEGHDRGFLLRAAQPRDSVQPPRMAPRPLAEALADRVRVGREQLDAQGGPFALYGANAYSQAFLGLYPTDARYVTVFDDTPAYEDQRAYGPGVDIPIRRPSRDALANVSAAVITAYLHDAAIARKLDDLGFHGPVRTVRADDLAGAGPRPPGLFHVRRHA